MGEESRLTILFQLHMIENRYRLEKEIYRGRVFVRQTLQAREKDRVPPDVDQGAGADVDTPGAGPSAQMTNGRSASRPKLPWPSATSSHLPIESEAEAGFKARDPRFWRRGGPGANGDGAGSSSGVNGNGSRPEAALMQSGARRRWAASYVQEQDDDDDEDDEATPNSEPAPRQDGERPASPIRQLLPHSPSFIARLRTRSFPLLFQHPFGRSSGDGNKGNPTHGGTSGNRPSQSPLNPGDSRLSSESEDEEDVPWNGAMMTPRLTSRVSLGNASLNGLGLGLMQNGARYEGPEDDIVDELEEDEEGSASDPGHAGGVAEGLAKEAKGEVNGGWEDRPQQDGA